MVEFSPPYYLNLKLYPTAIVLLIVLKSVRTVFEKIIPLLNLKPIFVSNAKMFNGTTFSGKSYSDIK